MVLEGVFNAVVGSCCDGVCMLPSISLRVRKEEDAAKAPNEARYVEDSEGYMKKNKSRTTYICER